MATLLSEREGGAELGAAVQAAGLAWTWIPLPGGRPPEGSRSRRTREALVQLSERIDAGEAILMHCSAGMHRTGMLAYALLRHRGMDPTDALALIDRIRPLTRNALTPEHLAWGNQTVNGEW